MGQRKRKKGEEKRRAKFAIGKIEPLCATAPTSPRTHMFCPPSLRVATLISIPCPPVLLLPRVFFFLLLAASVCNFDPMYLRVSPFHGSCKKGGVDTCALCGLKNESQYVHDKIYIYICVYAEMSYPFYRLYVSTSFFSVPFREGRAREERRGGYYGHSYAAPPVRLRGCTLWPLSAQGSAIPMGAPMYPIQRPPPPPPPPCSRSLNTISPFNRHRLRSRFSSLLFPSLPFAPVCIRVPTSCPLSPIYPSRCSSSFFFFLFFFARGDRKDGYSETTRPRRRKKVLSGATRVCLTGNTARIESRLSSPSSPSPSSASFVLPQMASCLCRASTLPSADLF